jgi:hypothetical protein
LADDFSERDDAIGYRFRVRDEVGGVRKKCMPRR